MFSKRQIIGTLMLSPYYFTLPLQERRQVVQDLSRQYGRKPETSDAPTQTIDLEPCAPPPSLPGPEVPPGPDSIGHPVGHVL